MREFIEESPSFAMSEAIMDGFSGKIASILFAYDYKAYNEGIVISQDWGLSA
jgi:hypothetical protein